MKQHEDPAAELMMSTVNCAGVLILSSERQPQMASQLREQISALPIRFVAPSVQQAEIAAEARLKFPLHPGDCFAYALAKEQNCGLLTLDRDFRKTELLVLTAAAKRGLADCPRQCVLALKRIPGVWSLAESG